MPPAVPAQILALTLPADPSIIAAAIGFIAVAYIYMKGKRNTRRDPLAGPPPFSSLSAQRRVENTMTELLVELEKMARQMNAQLDTRSAKLEELIRQADERIAELRRLGGEDAAEQLRHTLAGMRATPSGPKTPPTRIPPSAVGLDPDADLEGDFVQADFPDVDTGPAPIPIDPRHAAVYRLADQGRTLPEIAREVGQPAGEVELILALRRRAR